MGQPLRGLGQPEIPARQPGPEPQTHGGGLAQDIFYHHRMDPTPTLEENMMALDTAVQKGGKALYAGILRYDLGTHPAGDGDPQGSMPVHHPPNPLFDLRPRIETDGVKSLYRAELAAASSRSARWRRAFDGQIPERHPEIACARQGRALPAHLDQLTPEKLAGSPALNRAGQNRGEPWRNELVLRGGEGRVLISFKPNRIHGKPGDHRPHLLYRGRASGDRRDQPAE